MNSESVQTLGDWVPIRDCPGRFVLRGVSPNVGLAELVGPEVKIRQCSSRKARDAIFVVVLEDGGLISYCRPAGTWTHTLGTREGSARKLKQLEITLAHE